MASINIVGYITSIERSISYSYKSLIQCHMKPQSLIQSFDLMNKNQKNMLNREREGVICFFLCLRKLFVSICPQDGLHHNMIVLFGRFCKVKKVVVKYMRGYIFLSFFQFHCEFPPCHECEANLVDNRFHFFSGGFHIIRNQIDGG